MKGYKQTKELRDFNVGKIYNINYSEMLQKPNKSRLCFLYYRGQKLLQEEFPPN